MSARDIEDLLDQLPKLRHEVRRPSPKMNPPSFRVLLDMLMSGSHTVKELQDATGLAQDTIRSYLKSLITPINGKRLIFIFSWDKDVMGRDSNPRYRWGNGINMPRASRDAGPRRKEARQLAATINTRRVGGHVHRVED